MPDMHDELLAMCQVLCMKPSEAAGDGPLLSLRSACRTDHQARKTLGMYLYEGDGRQRILAAEALSWTSEFGHDAVPILTALVEVLVQNENLESFEDWAVLGLGALCNYGAEASPAAPGYWPLLYKPAPLNVRLYATKLAARLAKEGDVHWTIWCLLCRHEEEAIRECARAEFKEYTRKVND